MVLKEFLNQIIAGDCREVLSELPAKSADLIVTSPPYGSRRKNSYGGIHPDHYVEWFLPISLELKRVLKDTGSFILNIKENVEKGERHTYVIELVLQMRMQGWLWTEDYVWHKKNCYPGKWPNRFRDAWEHCFHFTKQHQFAMYQDAVRVPMGDWKEKRLRRLSETDMRRDNSRAQSGFGKRIANWVGREFAYPTNVLHLATECSNRGHSAAFPLELPTWFIQLLTKPGDVVFDPFIGSGTTAIAAAKLHRHFVGIEIDAMFVKLAKERLRAEEAGKSIPLILPEYANE